MTIAVIRIRGRLDVPARIDKTLDLLKLRRIFTMRILEENDYTKGMLHKAKDFTTYGKLSEELAKKFKLNKIYFLKPPRGGFKKSKRHHFPRGELGDRKEKINDLIKKMM